MEFNIQNADWWDNAVDPALRIFKKCSKIQSFTINVEDCYSQTPKNADDFLLRISSFLKYNKSLQELHISYSAHFSAKSLKPLLHRISKLRTLKSSASCSEESGPLRCIARSMRRYLSLYIWSKLQSKELMDTLSLKTYIYMVFFPQKSGFNVLVTHN